MFNTMRSEMEHVLQFTDGYFNLARYAEKLGRSNGCNQLALSAKGMPVRPSPVHILWAAEALFFLVSKLWSPVCGGRLMAAVLCCCCCPLWNAPCWAAGAWKVLPWEQGRSMWKAFFCAVLCSSFPFSSDYPSHWRERVGLLFAFSFQVLGYPLNHKNVALGRTWTSVFWSLHGSGYIIS